MELKSQRIGLFLNDKLVTTDIIVCRHIRFDKIIAKQQNKINLFSKRSL
jgi:hypothetical protein